MEYPFNITLAPKAFKVTGNHVMGKTRAVGATTNDFERSVFQVTFGQAIWTVLSFPP